MMAYALMVRGKEVKQHWHRESCVIEAYERGFVFQSRGGKLLMPGVYIEERPSPPQNPQSNEGPE